MSERDSVFPINVVIQMTQLTARQIRYYENSGLVKPLRSKGNHRLYNQADVANLELIKSLMEKGLTLDGVRAILENKTPAVHETHSVPTTALFSQHHPYIPQLTSLYPVNNQKALLNRLQSNRK